MNDLSPYKLSILAAIVVLVLSAAVVGLVGGWANAGIYLSLVGTVAVPSLLALLRSEATAKKLDEAHGENQDAIATLASKIDQVAKRGERSP